MLLARILDASGVVTRGAVLHGVDRLNVAVNPALLRLLAAKRVLLLQGPVGSFFDRLAHWLKIHHIHVERVAFQAGDVFDSRLLQPICFNDEFGTWPAFFDNLVNRLRTDCIVLFGQVRAYHRVAMERARAAGISVVVLEEGYIRPGYITMELDGVNGYSRTLDRYNWTPASANSPIRLEKPLSSRGQFGLMARSAMNHYWAMNAGKGNFPFYQHHKSTSIFAYCKYWVKSWAKKQAHRWHDHRQVQRLSEQSYFLVPLQHDGDSQITHHSRFGENTKFIFEVMRSFADNAPEHAVLVFKQHPFSRGGPGHAEFIRSLARELEISHRVSHLIEGHTPTLVKKATAIVVINSTVGLQALLHRKPLMTLGEAIYSGPGLTHDGHLDDFWASYQQPVETRVEHLINQIIHLTQVPCNVYGPRGEPLLWHVTTDLTRAPFSQ